MRSTLRALVPAAATLGALLGALPGAVVMARATAPLPTIEAGAVLLACSAVTAALLAAWTANLGLDHGRSLLRPLFASALAVGLLVALLWVLLVASGAWAWIFPFPPFFGVLGCGLVLGACVGFVALRHRGPHDWDALDVAVSLAWAIAPPALVALLVKVIT